MTRLNLARTLTIVAVLLWLVALSVFEVGPSALHDRVSLQAMVSLAGIVIGFIILSWQLDRQHANALVANRRQAQDRLRAELYSEIAKRIESTSVPLTRFASVGMSFINELVLRQQADFRASRYRFKDLQAASQASTDCVVALMSILETHEIVMPEFAVFRGRLAGALRDAGTAYSDFLRSAAFFLEREDGGAVGRRQPSDEELGRLRRLAVSKQEAVIRVLGVVWDLRVEAQNYLLGDVFPGRRVPSRMPGDPAIQVTTLDASTPEANDRNRRP